LELTPFAFRWRSRKRGRFLCRTMIALIRRRMWGLGAPPRQFAIQFVEDDVPRTGSRDRGAARHPSHTGGGAERGLDCHADGLSGGVAIANLGDVSSHPFGIPVLEDGEEPDFAVLHGRDLCRVVPHIRFGANSINLYFRALGPNTKKRRRPAKAL
jgi:hypothetical protein